MRAKWRKKRMRRLKRKRRKMRARFNQISDNLTHIVIGEKINKDIDQIKALITRPHIVTPQWLVDCYKNETLLDVLGYASPELAPPNPGTPNMKGVRKKSRLVQDGEKPSGSRQSVGQPATTGHGDDMNDIMSQYLDNPAEGDTTKSNDTTVAPPVVDEDMTQDPNNTTAMETEGGIFCQKYFVFYGFEEEHVPELSTFIKENGGGVLQMNARRIPDYAIVPIDGFPVDRTVKEIVTNAWLQSCIEQNTLLDVNSNSLYTPIEIRVENTPLKDCVLSVSGYVGTERDCWMYIADVLGARTQDYFVRNAKNGLQPSTHLIVNAPEGSKYAAAKKWKIPALSTAWLLACAKSGKREPEEKYLIDNINDLDNDIVTKPLDKQSNVVEADNQSAGVSDKNTNQSDHRTRNIASDNQSKDGSDNDNQSNLRKNHDTAENENCVAKDLGKLQLQDGAQTRINTSTAGRQSIDNLDADHLPDFSATGTTEALLLQMNTQGEQNADCDKVPMNTAENDMPVRKDDNISRERTVSSNVPVDIAEDSTTVRADDNVSRNRIESESAQHNYKKDAGRDCDKKSLYRNDASPGTSEMQVCEAQPLTRSTCNLEDRTPAGKSPALTMGIRNRLKNLPVIRHDWRALERKQKALEQDQRADSKHGEDQTTETSPSQKENLVASSTPLQSRVKELKKTEGRNKANAVDKVTPSKFLNPNVRYYPKFDTEELMKAWVTPDAVRTARAKRKNSLPLDELFELKFAEAEQNLKRAKERKLEEEQLSQSQEDGGGEMYSEPSTVLRGVVIAVGKKLVKDQSEFNEIVTSLGGDYRWNYDSSCTHFIFQGRQNDTAKDFKLAKSQELKIVSPHWLYLCKEQNARVEESLFPHTFNPNLSLSVVSTKRTPLRTPARGTRRNMRINSKQEEIAPPPTESIVSKGRNQQAATPKGVSRVNLATPRRDDEVNIKDNVFKSPEKTSSDDDKMGPDNEENVVDELGSSFGEDGAEEAGVSFVDDGVEETGGSLEMREVLSRQLENVMAESKGKKKRKSRRLNCSGQVGTPRRRRLQDSLGEHKKNPSTRSSRSTSGDKVDEKNSGEMAPSQSVHVVWDDPMGRMEQEKLAHKLERANSPTQEVGGMYDLDPADAQYSEDTDEEAPVPQFQNQQNIEEPSTTPKIVRQHSDKTPTPEGPSIAFPTNSRVAKVTPPRAVLMDEDQPPVQKSPPIFMLSGMSQAEKDDYGALIEQLSGKLLDTQQFDSRCTHLVISNVTRNEKFLASIAAGKWVLHKSYFEACRNEQCFVQEDFYEWGSEGTLSLVKNMDTNVRLLAIAARDWRIKIQQEKLTCETKSGAFCSWRVVLCCDKNREGNYRRLLEAGGATVLNIKPPFTGRVDATHALLELHKVSLSQDDLESLVSSDCLCLKPEYISAHLSNPDVDVAGFYPPEIEALKAVLSQSGENTRKRRNLSSSNGDKSLKRSKKK